MTTIEVRHNGVPFLRGSWEPGSDTENGGMFAGVSVPEGKPVLTGLAPSKLVPGRTFHEAAAPEEREAAPTSPRRVMLSRPNTTTGVRLLLSPRRTLEPYAGWGWVVIGRVAAS